MYQVAIYNDQQHEQFTGTSDHFALRESNLGNGLWKNAWELNQPPSPGELRLHIAGDTVRIEAAPESLQSDHLDVQAGDTFPLPCLLQIDATWIEIATPDQPRDLVPLKQTTLDETQTPPSASQQHTGPSAATVTKWLSDAGQLHRAAAGSAEFYADAARFAVNTVGLDATWVLRRCDDQADASWQIVGSHLPHPEQGIRFDPVALEQLAGQSIAWFQPAATDGIETFSQAIVIAPVLDKQGKLIAAIYGVRNMNGNNRRRGIRPLEARLVQLLAESVAVGIARLQQETEATRARILLEHAFSPTIAQHIQQHPECLLGQEREVTMMFADLRGYTAIAESMELNDCYDLLGDVMETLTQIVVRQRGVVIDYYGDGLLALWNAPLEQPNHADLACQAAIEMFEQLPTVAKRWQDRLSAPLELGIGIHSGAAYVGNAGTRTRMKYGPRGNAVNIASRVQSASKQLQLPLVITSATQTKLSPKFSTLRVCTAKLPGLEQPEQLFTVYPATKAKRIQERLDQYSRALELFEAGELEAAEVLLTEIKALGPVTPASFLAHYAAAQKNGNRGRRVVDKQAASLGPVIEIFSK